MSKGIDNSKIEKAREAKRKRMEEARLRRQTLRDKNEKLKEGFDGVMSYSIYEQEELDSATQRAKESAEGLEKIANRFQEDDSIQPNAKQAEYVLSQFYHLAGNDINSLIEDARRKEYCGGTGVIVKPQNDSMGIKLAIDNDTLTSLKRSWEIAKEKLQDVFESEYDTENSNRRFCSKGSICGYIDDLLDDKYGNVEYEFFLLRKKVYDSYYGKPEKETETEGNNEQ